jgi:hypothetical protein
MILRHAFRAHSAKQPLSPAATPAGQGAFVTFVPAVSLCVRLLQGDEVEEVEDPLFSFIAAAAR